MSSVQDFQLRIGQVQDFFRYMDIIVIPAQNLFRLVKPVQQSRIFHIAFILPSEKNCPGCQARAFIFFIRIAILGATTLHSAICTLFRQLSIEFEIHIQELPHCTLLQSVFHSISMYFLHHLVYS